MNLELIQGTKEWLLMRQRFVMASDTPVLMGVSKYGKTPLMLWEEKLGLSMGQVQTGAMEYGRRNEEVARELYCKMAEVTVLPDVIFHPTVKHMGASLDGLSTDKTLAVEIKCSNAANHELAKNGMIPEEFYPQLQHQLACLGHKRMHYFSWYRGEGIIVECFADEEYMQKMYKKIDIFWKHVENLTEPDLEDGDYRQMDSSWLHKARTLWEMEERIRKETKLAKELKEELKRESDGRNSRFADMCLSFTSKKGMIQYDDIPDLQGVDLEKYRSEPTVSCSLKKL